MGQEAAASQQYKMCALHRIVKLGISESAWVMCKVEHVVGEEENEMGSFLAKINLRVPLYGLDESGSLWQVEWKGKC